MYILKILTASIETIKKCQVLSYSKLYFGAFGIKQRVAKICLILLNKRMH